MYLLNNLNKINLQIDVEPLDLYTNLSTGFSISFLSM